MDKQEHFTNVAIWMVLILGQVSFAAVAVMLNNDGMVGWPKTDSTLVWVGLIAAGLAYPLALIVRGFAGRKESPDGGFRVKFIAVMLVLEAACLVNIIVFMMNTAIIHLGAVLLLIAMQVSMRPKRISTP